MTIWNPETKAFVGPMLHRALIARGYTVEEFAGESGGKPWSLYNALKGRQISDKTTIRIFKGLERRNPMPVVSETLEVA